MNGMKDGWMDGKMEDGQVKLKLQLFLIFATCLLVTIIESNLIFK